MDYVDEWDGRRARLLQEALRMTGEDFAEKLGVAVRTVRDWHSRPDMRPRQHLQQALDELLEGAPAAAKARFRRHLAGPDSATPDGTRTAQALTVAIAAVVRDDEVLLVCRRGDDGGGITWQFPAGVVKPGADPAAVAVHETLGETGVHCSVRRPLGRRLHPVTGVYCEYFLCDYLAGRAENRDIVENVNVEWVDRDQVIRFIPQERIFPPVFDALVERDDSAS